MLRLAIRLAMRLAMLRNDTAMFPSRSFCQMCVLVSSPFSQPCSAHRVSGVLSYAKF
jgi:hypothetical protein